MATVAPLGEAASRVWNSAPDASDKATVPSLAPEARMRSLDVHLRHVMGSVCGSKRANGAPTVDACGSQSETSSSDAEARSGGARLAVMPGNLNIQQRCGLYRKLRRLAPKVARPTPHRCDSEL